MFSKPPAYTTADLDAAVTRIERLHKLYEQTEQYIRLNGQKMDEPLLETFSERQVMYNRNIKTSQLYYQKMVERLNK